MIYKISMILELNKKETLVNFGNSILNYYGCQTFHKTYKNLDVLLKKHKNKKVCLILLDGLGKKIIEQYKDYCPFLYAHSKCIFESIYPPTTVAATNALLLAKYPSETGYVGWTQYFKKYNRFIDVFPSIDSLSGEIIKPHVCSSLLENKNIVQYINETNKFKARQYMGFDFKNGEDYDLDALFEFCDKNIELNDFNYIYSSEPDHSMHDYGVINDRTKELIIKLDNLLKDLTTKHKDYLFLVIADHGMVDCTKINFLDYPDFVESISNQIPVIEARFAGFFVKNEEKFIECYNKYFKDKFILYSKEDVLKNNIFGYTDNDKYSEVFQTGLCDYYLISNTSYAFSKNDFFLKGNHAGGTTEEKLINLSVFNLED